MAKAGYFVSRWKAARRGAPENSRPPPLPARPVRGPIALSKAEARSSPTAERMPACIMTAAVTSIAGG